MDPTTPSISPFLFCHDVPKSQRFLVDAFGMRPGPGDDQHATVFLDDQCVHLARPHPGRMEPADALDKLHSLVMVYVGDVDALFTRAVKAGATVEYEPRDMPYGQRECGVRDLDGHYWSIATLTG